MDVFINDELRGRRTIDASVGAILDAAKRGAIERPIDRR